MKKIILISILILLIPLVYAGLPVKDGSIFTKLAIADCGEPYCSTLSPGAYLVKCGDITYKYYCPDGEICENGYCTPQSNVCTEGWVTEYYCSTLSNARLRQWRNEDCSTTTYKWTCSNDEKCQTGECIKIQPECREEWINDWYCSGLSNAKLRGWQNKDCSITTYKSNCDSDEKCELGECISTGCNEEWITDYYCSSLSNAKLRQRQLTDCSIETLKWQCDSDEVCKDGDCIPDTEICEEKWITDHYCSTLSNARMRQRQLSDCRIETLKWQCGINEVCEDGQCVEKILCSTKPEKPCPESVWKAEPFCKWDTVNCDNCETDEDCEENEICENSKCVPTEPEIPIIIPIIIGAIIFGAIGTYFYPGLGTAGGAVIGGLAGYLIALI